MQTTSLQRHFQVKLLLRAYPFKFENLQTMLQAYTRAKMTRKFSTQTNSWAIFMHGLQNICREAWMSRSALRCPDTQPLQITASVHLLFPGWTKQACATFWVHGLKQEHYLPGISRAVASWERQGDNAPNQRCHDASWGKQPRQKLP